MAATCAGETIPVVRLALAKERCARVKAVAVNNPSSIAAWVAKHYGCNPQENFLGLFFNPRMEIIAVHEVALGALDSTAVDPRVLYAAALLAGATAMVIAHNHPSGNPEPSAADIELTKLIAKGSKLLGIKLIDHLVIARGGGYTSFLEKGFSPVLEGR